MLSRFFTQPFQHKGALAQLVEQRTLNPLVVGSIPTRPTIFQRLIGRAARSIFPSFLEDALGHLELSATEDTMRTTRRTFLGALAAAAAAGSARAEDCAPKA